MNTARIAELLAPFLEPGTSSTNSGHSETASGGEEPVVLSGAQLESISTYIDLLLRWNARLNLTAVRDPEQIVTRHFGESLFAARRLFPAEATGRVGAGAFVERSSTAGTSCRPTVADLGSGAGFPGIPIRLWAPHISLTLIESNHKKAAFLREVARALTLTDIDIVAARAESLTNRSFDVVTLRAVERFENALPVAARLIAPGGRLGLLIGAAQLEQAHSRLPTLSWNSSVPVPLSRNRVLGVALMSKLGYQSG